MYCPAAYYTQMDACTRIIIIGVTEKNKFTRYILLLIYNNRRARVIYYTVVKFITCART